MGSSVLHGIKLMGILALLLCSSISLGATVGLLVEDNNLQVKQFQLQLSKLRPSDQFQLFTLQKLPKKNPSKEIKTWIAMGAKSLAVLLGRIDNTNTAQPAKILGLFVRPEAISKLTKLYPDSNFSLLDNTPPIARQLALIKVISAQLKTIAVLHSKQHPFDAVATAAVAQKMGLTLITSELSDPLNWERESLRALKDADVILGMNDTAIYNATTIRSILMRLYRASRPLIGPDKGYVRAGAVASTYSGVTETIKAVAELLDANKVWPNIIPNPHFNVVINAQVARSLNINVTDPELLSLKVREALSE